MFYAFLICSLAAAFVMYLYYLDIMRGWGIFEGHVGQHTRAQQIAWVVIITAFVAGLILTVA